MPDVTQGEHVNSDFEYNNVDTGPDFSPRLVHIFYTMQTQPLTQAHWARRDWKT